MNSVNLIGNIGNDLELKRTNGDKGVCNFNLAVGGYNRTDWISIVAWEKTAETICAHLKKGSKIGVTGSLRTRKYTDKDGNNRTVTEVVAENVSFVESKPSGNSEASSGSGFDVVGVPVDDLPF